MIRFGSRGLSYEALYDLAARAARDAANMRMKAEGRRRWNRADWYEACRVFDEVYPAQMKTVSK